MYADRHSRGVNGGSLTLSVGIVGGLVAAAMLSNTVIKEIRQDKGLITYQVPPAPPPPPVDTTPPRQQLAKAAPRIDQPVQRVPTPAPTAPYVAPPLLGPTATPGTAEGLSVLPLDPPKPPTPVVTTAGIDPRYARDFQPAYPPAEQRAGKVGLVVIKVLIGVDGRVRQVEQVAAASPDFWRVTERQALSRWRFKPATRDGIPVESWRTMTVRFTLQDG